MYVIIKLIISKTKNKGGSLCLIFQKGSKIIQNNEIFSMKKNALIVYFKCNKCGETFKSYLRKGYDIINDYDNDGFIVDKEYIGSKCPTRIHLHASFDRNYNLINYTLDNGKIITKEEWENEK